MKILFSAMIGIMALAMSANAQTTTDFGNQAVVVGGQYDQASTPSATGFVAYGRRLNDRTFSYTMIRETSLTIKNKPAIQTQTETGICVYGFDFNKFHVFSCGTGGLATAGSNTGLSVTASVLVTRGIGNSGWFVGGLGGPSYSGANGGKTTYPVGALIGWSGK